MIPGQIADREQRAVVGAALRDICGVSGIEAESREYDDAARLLTHFYRNGHRTVEQLKSALDPETLEALFG